jgi:2-dehydropantoate 2-reductase
MGCLLGGYLARAGHEVFLVDVDSERVAAIEQGGLSVEGVGGDFDVSPGAGTTYAGAPPELVVVCVKAYDTDRAGRSVATWIDDHSTVLTLQNGVGNLEQLAHHLPREQIMAGVTSLGANLLRPGHVHHAGEGDTYVGHLSGEETESEPAEQVAEVLSAARLPTTVSPDIRTHIWGKLAVNVGINALTAILRVRNGKLLTLGHTESLMREAVQECLQVAQASGIPLPEEATQKRVREVARRTASNRSSMLMDMLARRRSEVDAINGAVVRRGVELGVPVPVNQTLTRLIHALEGVRELQEK